MPYYSMSRAFPCSAGVKCLKQTSPIQCIQGISQCYRAANHWLSQLTPGHEPHSSSLVYHYPENLIDKIYCQVCFLLQHLGMNNMQKLIQPYVSSSTEWCPQDRSQKFSWALLLVPRPFAVSTSLRSLRKKGLSSVLNVHLTKALMQWSFNYWFQRVWKWEVLMNKQK